jgi:hypothetical protein
MSKITRDWIIVTIIMISMIVGLNAGVIWYSYKLQDERFASQAR